MKNFKYMIDLDRNSYHGHQSTNTFGSSTRLEGESVLL